VTGRGGKVRTIVSTPSTGAKLRAKALRVNKAPRAMRSSGRANKLQARLALGTPGSDDQCALSSAQGTIVISTV